METFSTAVPNFNHSNATFVTRTTNAAIKVYQHPISDEFMRVFAALLLVTSIVAITGNVLVVISFCRIQRLRKKAANVYTINLAVGNFLLGIVAGRIAIDILRGKFIATENCDINGFIVSAVHISVITTITAMIVDRFLVICRRKNKLEIFHLHPNLTVVFIWLYSALWSIPPLTPYVPSYMPEEVMPCCVFDRFSNVLANRLYIFSMCTSVFFLPLLAMGYCLVRIFFYVRTSSNMLAQHAGKRILIAKKSPRQPPYSFTDTVREIHNGSGITSPPSPQVEYKMAKLRPPAEKEEEDILAPRRQLSFHKSTAGESPVAKPALNTATQQLTNDTPRKERLLKRILTPQQSVSSCDQSTALEMTILRSALILLTLFVSSWLPFTVVSVYNSFGNVVSPSIAIVCYLFAKASCVHSSLAYITNAHFIETARLLCFWKRGASRSYVAPP